MKNRLNFLLRKTFYCDEEIRLVWSSIIIVLIIVLGEYIIVDPFGELLKSIGLTDAEIPNAHNWSTAIYEVLKRSLRTVLIVFAVWITIIYLRKRPFSFTGFS